MTPELFQILAPLGADLAELAANSFGVFIRVGAMMALVPAFGEQSYRFAYGW